MATGHDDVVLFQFERGAALVSNQNAHGADPQTFVAYTDLINDAAGNRRKRPGRGAPLGASAGAEITQLHEFARVNPTNGAVTYHVFRTFGTKIQKSTNGGASWTDTVIPFVPQSSAWVFKNFNNRCFATNGKDHLIYFDSTTGPDGREWYYVGVDAPAVAPGYQALNLTEYTAGTVNVVEGSYVIVGVGVGNWLTLSPLDGRIIEIAGVPYTISTIDLAAQITIRWPPYKGPTAAGLSYRIYRGFQDWEEPHSYAVGYRNSTTGHIGNVGPKLTLAEKDQTGRIVTLTGIPYNAQAFLNGYDEIQIFRTPRNGSTLVAIDGAAGRVANANIVGSTTWTETAATYKDTNLSNLEAPYVTNRRPVDGAGAARGFSALAEWNGRLFALCPRESRWYFCGAPEDVRHGIPEFCWPEKYGDRVTEAKGMIEIGTGGDADQVIVHTAFGDRAIVGFDPLSFRLRRVPTRPSEGFQGGAAFGPSGLVELHRDRRLMDYGSGRDLGRPIQDRLNDCNAAAFTKARVAWFEYESRNFLIVSVPLGGAATANDRTFVIDYDLDYDGRIFDVYEWSFGCSALLPNVHNTATGELELWAGSPTGEVFRLLGSVFVDNGANVVPVMRTAHLRIGENVLGRLAFIEISSAVSGFTGSVYVDEETNLSDPGAKGIAFALDVAEVPHQTAKGKKQLWQPSERVIDGAAFQVQISCPSTAADIVIEKLVIGIQRISEPQVTP